MRLYKFRSLASTNNFNYAKEILETNKFRLSQFSDLNDPMEGGFHAETVKIVNKIYDYKKRFKICSFSGKKALKNLLMWGYYASGFMGIAIEIETEKEEQSKIMRIKYKDDINFLDRLNVNNVEDKTRKILTTKLKKWRHENEYRFLEKTSKEFVQIGKITSIYFGLPYDSAANRDNILDRSEKIQEYINRQEELKNIAQSKNISFYYVKIKNAKIVIN